MDNLLLFVLGVLATFWVWWFLAQSKLEVVARRRESLYNRWPPTAVRATTVGVWMGDIREVVQSARVEHPDRTKRRNPKVSVWAKGFDCPWCFGFWLAGLATLVLAIGPGIPLPLLWWPATAAAVGLIGSR